MWYGDKRDSLVKLSDGLRWRGWSIYGYKEDKSDSMTDYFDPAHWGGIAVKNGFVLVVDGYSGGTIGGDFIQRSYDPKIAKRVRKLQTLADNHAAAKGERENALAMIEKLNPNMVKEILITGDKPAISYQKNPGNTKWHIEKDGDIIAKGTGVFSFGDVNTWRDERIVFEEFEPNDRDYFSYHNFDDAKAEWSKHYENRKEKEQKQKVLLDKYFKLLDKWDALTIIKLGDGEEEKLVKRTIEKKTTYYVAEVSDKPTDYVRVGEGWRRASGLEKGILYKLSEDKQYTKTLTKNWVVFQDGTRCETFKQEPRKNTKSHFAHLTDEAYEEGHFEYVNLVKKDDVTTEVVWEKQKRPKQKAKKTQTKEVKVPKGIESDLVFEELIVNGDIVDFQDTRDENLIHKVLKLQDQLSKDDFKRFHMYIRGVKKAGYYSRFAKGFILYPEYIESQKSNDAIEEDKTPEIISAEIFSPSFTNANANGTLF